VVKLPSKVALIALSFPLSACYHHRLLTFGGNAGSVSPFQKTIHAGFWGLRPKPIVPPEGSTGAARCADNGMFDVVVHSNFGYSAVTVVTLGLWSPLRAEWYCAAPIPVVGPALGASHAPAASTHSPQKPGAEPPFTPRNLYSLVWGAIERDARAPAVFSSKPPGPPTPLNCAPDADHLYGMRKVEIPVFPHNYFYSIATVATLGFYSPVHVAWQCVVPSTPPKQETGDAR
jgi:hypothetical protein